MTVAPTSLGSAAPPTAERAAPGDDGAAAAPLEGLFREHCFACHDAESHEAEINLERLLAVRPLVRNRKTWARVLGVLEAETMPPARRRQPSAGERARMLDALRRAVVEFDYESVDNPGFEPLRRLTHHELENTLRDLLGVEFELTSRFPAELSGPSGFENSANTLSLQPNLMERYIALAERAIETALPAEPTSEEERRARELLLVARPGEGPDGSLSEATAAERILERFLLRSYRRPPRAEELARYRGHFEAARRSGANFEAAIKQVLAAVLISPGFLFRVEAPQDGEASYRIDDWALASRLSYFLWASMPDDALFELARRGTLHEPAVLEAQVRRMLVHPKAETLGDLFAAQWLGYRHVGTRIRLDPIDNPWCTDTLMEAMRRESSLFFLSLVRENQPIERLLDADYTFVNEELARTLYGMEGISGSQMRRIALEDANRGGILGHGSILAVTSNYKTTSPVKRGIWILETLLGTPPPPPPAGAGEFSEEVAERERLSFREKLALHSRDESCRSCHSRIDPLGFALENFDYFGRWREAYGRGRRAVSIDASGKLPDGTRFTGPAELKRALVEQRRGDLVRQVVQKLLAYALGREIEYYDERAVRRIVAALEEEGAGFETLFQAVVASYPFQFKKNQPEP